VTQAAVKAQAFYREVAEHRRVWTLRDDGGFSAPLDPDGCRCAPFWSKLSRVEKVIGTVAAYSGFRPGEIPWSEFRDRWLPGLEKDGLLVGVTWSGPPALGYDVEPERVRQSVEAAIERPDSST